MAFEKKEGELGALWQRQGRKGEYLSGQIDGVGDVICWPIESTNPKAPKWRVMKATPREERQAAPPMRDDVPPPRDEEFSF
jgi:hypothetical protein